MIRTKPPPGRAARWWASVARRVPSRLGAVLADTLAIGCLAVHVSYALEAGGWGWAGQCAACVLVAYFLGANRAYRRTRKLLLTSEDLIEALYKDHARLEAELALRDHEPTEIQ